MVSLNWLWGDKRKSPLAREGDGIWETDCTADVLFCKIMAPFILMKQCFLLVFVPLILQRGILFCFWRCGMWSCDVQKMEFLPPLYVAHPRTADASTSSPTSGLPQRDFFVCRVPVQIFIPMYACKETQTKQSVNCEKKQKTFNGGESVSQ